jgi:hypothetical protein
MTRLFVIQISESGGAPAASKVPIYRYTPLPILIGLRLGSSAGGCCIWGTGKPEALPILKEKLDKLILRTLNAFTKPILMRTSGT